MAMFRAVCAAVDNISTDNARRAVPLRGQSLFSKGMAPVSSTLCFVLRRNGK